MDVDISLRPQAWIDVENPPQVQYLLPFRAAFEARGLGTVITARDYGRTVEMLQGAGVQARVVGRRVGRGKLRKGRAAIVRARDLVLFFRRVGRPVVLVAASRPAAMAARWMGVPNFVLGDYEHVHLELYRLTKSKLLHPDVIDASHYVRHWIRRDQLIAFSGLKEDLTFAGLDLDAVEPYDLGDIPGQAVKILFRPPSETSHYYNATSTALARAALEWLAAAGALVVFAPREPEQIALLRRLTWRYPPVILRQSVPFASLLKSVDAVVCAGGTMLREAAYLGIPAYSIFCSQTGAVDRWLQQIGRAKLLSCESDLAQIELRRRGPLQRLDSNPHLLDQLAAVVTAAVADGRPIGERLAVA
jgi:uncharacterized protein